MSDKIIFERGNFLLVGGNPNDGYLIVSKQEKYIISVCSEQQIGSIAILLSSWIQKEKYISFSSQKKNIQTSLTLAKELINLRNLGYPRECITQYLEQHPQTQYYFLLPHKDGYSPEN